MTFGVQAVRVRFGDELALDDVSVTLSAGTIAAVVGGDGAGKTTLLRTIVREIAPESGSVTVPAKSAIGFLPASVGSWAALTVTQNLDFVGGAYGLTGGELRARREQLLAAAGLTAAADRLASQLSGGMRRKLGFCLAMIHRPALLVLDEPSTGVDPVSRVELWRLVSEAAADGAAVVLSTTYLDEAERAGLLVALDAGRVLAQGDYDAIRAGFRGVVTCSSDPVRRPWSWRRGRQRHEYWPEGDAPRALSRVDPDLEDIVIALSLAARAGTGAAP